MERTVRGWNLMGKGKRYVALVCMILILVSLSPCARAFDSKHTRPSLRGLERVWVLVEFLDPEIRKAGLSKGILEAETRVRLQKAGIEVLSTEEFREAGGACLYVNINTLKNKGYVYNINIQLIQAANLLRNPDIIVPVVTWSTEAVGVYRKRGGIRDYIKAQVKRYVERFIDAHRAVNTK
jgi:hypothetical protein